ncbi:hypothetical protein KKF81_00620 [Candidatus Micrarchaeota archaeon]|nr:hypothetical protein [Candidatus Micrarchaeota archaeon]MBU1165422.1 hypothetical protein [Candidatus Micrarchaeota archaeon]MBU1886969.1 hypothetical protein [Candidatus Micrarchaeota archaeon]
MAIFKTGTTHFPKSVSNTTKRALGLARRLMCPLLISFAISACENDAQNRSHEISNDLNATDRMAVMEKLELRHTCYELLFEDDFPDIPSAKLPSLVARKEEMKVRTEEFYRRMRRLKRNDENLAVYLDYFETSRYSTGAQIYPNVANVLRESEIFLNEHEKELAARRIINTLSSRRTEHIYDLLYYMPQTSVVMLDMINRSWSMMSIEDSEDVATFFLLLINSQRRIFRSPDDVPEKGLIMSLICQGLENGKIKRMSREQLKGFDSYYARRIRMIGESKTTCEETYNGTWITCNIESKTPGNLCEDAKQAFEKGELKRFGIMTFDINKCDTMIRRDNCGSPYALFGRDWKRCRSVAEKRGIRFADE